MNKEILIGEEIPVSQIGYSFVITTKNNINGRIIFSDMSGQLKSYSLTKNLRSEFNIPEMVKNNHISFSPDFVEFRSDDDLDTIVIDNY
jgi:hypothetical protein